MSACPHAHCDNCPLSWEERGLEDCDAGCLLYDDLYEGSIGCFLPLFLKRLYKAKLDRARIRYEKKAYADMIEWAERSEKRQACLQKALRTELPGINWNNQPFDAPARILNTYDSLCRDAGITE